jgi:hypothetical protein
MTGRFKAAGISRQGAEFLAIEALTFIASEPDRVDRFLAITGLNLANLREAAAAPGFLAAVLDYLAGSEDLLLAFAAHGGHDPAKIATARETLSPRQVDR